MAKIVLDGVAREVSIAREKDATVVIVDGRRYPVSEVASLPGGISFLVDGRFPCRVRLDRKSGYSDHTSW
jgi:hypothetical protein